MHLHLHVHTHTSGLPECEIQLPVHTYTKHQMLLEKMIASKPHPKMAIVIIFQFCPWKATVTPLH